ncbi:MAG: IS1182 family transposase [Calditrichia bacterium]
MGFISADRNQTDLLGYSLDDFVPQESKCRFVVDLISKLNLSDLYNRYSDQGNDALDPAVLLTSWFFAYSEGITSTRKLEDLCRYDMRYIYVSTNLRPDHTTLSRFRKKHQDLMSKYFIQIILFAQKLGISEFKEIAIDGTKIKASCSAKQSFKDDQLTRKIRAVGKNIAEYMKRCDLAEVGHVHDEDLDSIRKEKERLEHIEKKLVQRQTQLRERQKELKPEHRKNHQINIVEPDARFMPKSDGPSYNAQAAADSETNFILANDVVTEPNDQNQFSNIHQKVENNIGSDPKRKYDADSGYHSLKQLEKVEEKGIDAVISDPTPKNRSNNSNPTSIRTILWVSMPMAKKGRRVERSDFTYHLEEDYYECPAGQKLQSSKKNINSKSQSTIYKSSDCRDCPVKALCLPEKSQSLIRSIHRDNREILAEKMKEKLETDEAKSRLKTRATTIEPAFGNIKHNLGFRRFSLRGIEQVKGEFNLMCIAHNLNILFGLLVKGSFSFSIIANYLSYYRQIIMSKIRYMIYISLFSKIICFPLRLYLCTP